MKRVRKIALWVIGVVAVVAVGGWLGLQWYLNTASGRRLASDKLTAVLGMPVEVTSLRVGFGSTSVAVVIPDPAADPPADLLRVGSIDADITLLGLISGSATPTRVTVRDADVVLRLDANRKLVSPLPKMAGDGGRGKLPAVTVENARVRIRQPDKAEFDVSGVNATLSADGDGSAIAGDIADPTWGRWRIDGRLAADPADGRVTFTSDGVTVTDPLLRSVPFVKAKVWTHLSASGSTTAAVTLAFKPDGEFRYAVELRPKGVTVTFPDANATVTDVTGDVRIADGTVTATGAALTLAGGRAAVDGAFDYDKDVYVLTLKATAAGVDIRRLPAEWGLPKEIEGKLKGNADLEIHISDGGNLDTRGSGTGDVEGAKFAGLDAEIKLRLRGDNGRYYFDTMTPGK